MRISISKTKKKRIFSEQKKYYDGKESITKLTEIIDPMELNKATYMDIESACEIRETRKEYKKTNFSTSNENKFYKMVEDSKKLKKNDKTDMFGVPCFPPIPETKMSTNQTRRITTEILKNQGLTHNRNTKLKNPRKKSRLRFEKAKIRKKGLVQPLQSYKEFYHGEATGIKINLTKSI